MLGDPELLEKGLTLIGFLVSIVFLGYAAYSDLKSREVSNRVWIIYAPMACLLLLPRLLIDTSLILVSLISIAATTGLSLLLFYVGLFGGADCKAFICLSVALPTFPFSIDLPLIHLNPVFPVTVLYNAYLFSISTLFLVALRNIDWKFGKGKRFFNDIQESSFSRRFLAVLTGYKTRLKDLRSKVYLYPMEEVVDTGGHRIRRLRLFTGAESDRNQLVENLESSLSDGEKEEVWVTPGIPLLLFVWIALVFNAFMGDVLLWAVFKIASAFL